MFASHWFLGAAEAASAVAKSGAGSSAHMWVGVIVFAVAYLFIASEKVDKTIAAMLGAGLMVVLAVADFSDMLGKIDLNVLALLIGMMVIVNIMATTGVFEYLAVTIARQTRGNGLLVVLEFLVTTAVVSAFMQKQFKIGYLPLTKANWTNETLEAARKNAKAYLQSLPGVEVVGGDAMIDFEDKAIRELEAFEGERPNLIVAHFMTFSLGVIVPLFAQRLKIPVVLWSMKEPDPKGGRLQNNSFCAANMNSHFMYRMHVPYFHIHAEVGSDAAARGLEKAIRVTRTVETLSRMRVGLIGGRVPGFFTSCCDEMLLRTKIGPEVKFITEHEVIETARTLKPEELDAAMKTILSDAEVHPSDGPNDEQLKKSAALFAAVGKMKSKFLVDTFAMFAPHIFNDLCSINIRPDGQAQREIKNFG